MWIIDDKYGRLGIFQNKSKRVFKYLFDGGKKLLLAEYFERNNRTFFFCLATADSISVSVSLNANKAWNNTKLPEGTHVNDLELETVKITNIL